MLGLGFGQGLVGLWLEGYGYRVRVRVGGVRVRGFRVNLRFKVLGLEVRIGCEDFIVGHKEGKIVSMHEVMMQERPTICCCIECSIPSIGWSNVPI